MTNKSIIARLQFVLNHLRLTKEERKDIESGPLYEINVAKGRYYIIDGKYHKICCGYDYNFVFNKNNGKFYRWGKTIKDDPQIAPFPEILDIEVTERCIGVPDLKGIKSPCKFCYKSNGPNGLSMSLDNFKMILDRFHPYLCQIAIGADSEAHTNPDLWKMMEYTRSKGIIPNITVANITDETADQLVKYCGAVAVSRYVNKDVCYDTVKRLTDRGLLQTNIHLLCSMETFNDCKETLMDRLIDPRLSKLNAIVMLSLKRKGRGTNFTPLGLRQFNELVKFSFSNKLSIGFDSCSCAKFLEVIKNDPNYKQYEMVSEPCESSCMSSYCDVRGAYYPCSFCEGCKGWEKGIPITKKTNFIKDIWNHERTIEFRNTLIKNNRKCPMFEV